MNFLIVEDDFTINNILKSIVDGLKETYTNINCASCYTGSEAKNYITNKPVDIVLLDLMLPFVSGEELLALCQSKKIAVLVITAKNDVNTLVDVLAKGAGDYIAKPFHREEVIARLRKLIEQRFPEKQQILVFDNLELNPYTQTVTVNQQALKLTKIEFKILALFVKEPMRVFTKQQIYAFVWGDDFMQEQTLTVHLSHLRNKLRNAGFNDCIKVIWGVGWRLR